jgi:type I restriction enzyme S subunit
METEYWCDGTIPWFKTGELTDGPLIESEEAITELGLSNSSCKLWQTGTILIALYASPTVGRLGILEMPATANQACSALIVKPEYGNSFLFYALFFAREGLQNIAVGAAQQNVSQQVVRLHKVLIPDTKAASAFQQLVQRYYQLRVSNEKQSRLLAFIRDTLLPRLLSGRVRVNHVRKPIEEEMA